MANFNTPNLCGANPNLNESLDKINKLKESLTSNINADASAFSSALDSKFSEVKSAFDKLEVEMPSAPNVNLQSEITSLINDIDKTTVAGLKAFNEKVSSLKKDFGDFLKEKGVDFDKLVLDAETKIATGGNICDTVNNLELPASNSGTGTTTETLEERATGTDINSITLTKTPKSITSVFGKSSGNNFFGNASYTQSGRTITTTKKYTEIKVTYTINLIKEKPIAVKQPDINTEVEETVTIIKNIDSDSIKKQMAADYEVFKKGLNDIKANGKTDVSPVSTKLGTTIKVTPPKKAVTVIRKQTSSGVSYVETKRVNQSSNGLTTRKEDVIQQLKTALSDSVLANNYTGDKDSLEYQEYLEFLEFSDIYVPGLGELGVIDLKHQPWTFDEVASLRVGFSDRDGYVYEGIVPETIPHIDKATTTATSKTEWSTVYYKVKDKKLSFVNIAGKAVDPFAMNYLWLGIAYTRLGTIDPNFSG